MPNKIVVHYTDGRLQKGITTDFFPNKETFHFTPVGSVADNKPQEVHIAGMKAVFFVKEFDGIPGYTDKKEFESGKPVVGRKIKVLFNDGELMVGTTTGYQPDRPGFFVNPADAKSNVERCFVLTKSTREVKFL